MKRKPWTRREEQILKELYSNTRNSELSGMLNRSPGAICNRAHLLGLRKDREVKGINGVNVLEVIKQRQRQAGFLEE